MADKEHAMQIKWKKVNGGVIVKAGEKFSYATWIAFNGGHSSCYCTRNESNIETINN